MRDCPGLRREGGKEKKREGLLMSFGGDGNILELVVMLHKFVKILKSIEIYTLNLDCIL